MPPLPTFNIPNWKLLEQPVLPAQGTSIDLAPLVIMFLLLSVAVFLMVKLKRRQAARHVVQGIAACAFILGVSPCACMFRDLILGVQALNLDNLFAFRAMAMICTIVAFTLVFGRAFCAWICPLGSVQELAACASRRAARRLDARRLSTIRYGAAVLALALIVAGFIICKPKTFVFIEMAMVFWIMALLVIILFDVSNPSHERGLKSLRYVSLGLIGLVYMVGIYTGGPSCVMFRNSLDYSSIISSIGVIVASLIVGLAWCKFLCPEGALLGLISKLSPWRVGRTSSCTDCNACGDACLMNAAEQGEIDHSSCVLCGRCVDRCPQASLRFGAETAAAAPPSPAPEPEC